jgi:hypothetical protein
VFAELGEKQLKEFHYSDPHGREFKRTTLGDYSAASIAQREAEGYIYVSPSGMKYKKYYLDVYTIPSIQSGVMYRDSESRQHRRSS